MHTRKTTRKVIKAARVVLKYFKAEDPGEDFPAAFDQLDAALKEYDARGP